MAGNTQMICLGMKVKYFCAKGWTTQIRLNEFNKFSCWCEG